MDKLKSELSETRNEVENTRKGTSGKDRQVGSVELRQEGREKMRSVGALLGECIGPDRLGR